MIWRVAQRAGLGLAVLAGGWVFMVSDEKRFQALSKIADVVLDHVPVDV